MLKIAFFDRTPYDDMDAYRRFGDVTVHTRFTYHQAEDADVIVTTFSHVPDIDGYIINMDLTDADHLAGIRHARIVQARQWCTHAVVQNTLKAIPAKGTIAVVGHGEIGSHVYRALRARGRNPLWLSHAEAVPPVDIVTLHLKLVPSTKGWLDAHVPNLSGAYIVNTARRGLLSDKALAMGMQRGNIRGAYIDGGPELSWPGVTHTRHVAWQGPRSERLRPLRVIESLESISRNTL